MPDGTSRIGVNFHSGETLSVLVIPKSVTHIGYNDEYDYIFEDIRIKAPKGSYAIKFAKKHGIEFEEI